MERARLLHIKDFVEFCNSILGFEKEPKIILTEKKEWCLSRSSFGEYNPNVNSITAYVANRNLADIMRTIAHELVHHKQNELGKLTVGSGETGSEVENEANSMAGIILREYGKMNKLIYENKLYNK